MFKKCRILITLLTVICITLQLFTFSAAASSRASFTKFDTDVYLGESFEVKVYVSTGASSGIGSIEDAVVTYNSSVLQCTSYGGESRIDTPGTVLIDYSPDNSGTDDVTFAFTFKAIKAGSANIKFSGALVDWNESIKENISCDRKVTVTDKSTLPSNANIKSIKINQGTLSPSFSSSTTSYSVTVPNSVTKLIVTPTLSDSKATYAISGNSGLKVGTNNCVITVTAQNGSTKKYTIKITREADPNVDTPVVSEPDVPEVNPYEITINGTVWTLLSDYSLVNAPAGFSSATRVINGVEMPVFVNEGSGTTVVYATNSDNTRSAYFIYNGDDNEYSEYKFFVTDANTYVILDPERVEKVPSGFYYAETEVMGYNIGAYSYEDDAYADYVILYLETLDGNQNYYRYDMTDNSVQKATDFVLALSAKDNTTVVGGNIVDNFMAADLNSQIAVGATALVVILLIILIILTIVRISKNAKSRKAAEGVAEDEDVEELNFAAIIDGEEPTEAFDPNELDELKASEQEDDF